MFTDVENNDMSETNVKDGMMNSASQQDISNAAADAGPMHQAPAAAVAGEEKLDVTEVADELVRNGRYGRRNYRNSIGSDNRRHWHGEFLVEEEDAEGEEKEMDAQAFEEVKKAKQDADLAEAEDEDDVLAKAEKMMDSSPMDGAPDGPPEATEPEDSPEPDEQDDFVEPTVLDQMPEAPEEEVKEEDEGNIADVSYGDFDDEAPEYTEGVVENFMDPLQDVDGLEDVVSDPDQTVEENDQEEQADAEERTDTVS